MNFRALSLIVSCLVAFGCEYPTIVEGARCNFGATPSRCRPGYVCAPTNFCTMGCDAGQTLECATEDGGAGTSVCGSSGWNACVAVVGPACTGSQTEACRISMGGIDYYGERTCVDGGFTDCASVAASRCTSRPFGICADAGRVFGDIPGCTVTSFTRLAGFAEDEQCPGDTIDNDCDGYVDELFSDAGIACGSGPVCGATGPDGILKAYRTCQAPVCPSFLFERLRDAGYEPLDRCDDNVDRDCSGEPGEGPLVAMRRAEEAVVLADPSAVGGVFRMVVVGAVSDGGTDRELRFSSWNSNLIDLNGGVDVSIGTAAPDGSPINPMLQPTAVGSVISWKAGPAAFGIAYTLGSAVVLPKRFQSPYPIRSTPEVAQFVRDTLIAAEIRITGADGGTVSVAYLTTIDTSTPEGPVDAGNIYPGSPVVLRGNGGRIGVAFAGAPGGGAWLEVGTDPSLLADGGFVQFSPSASFRFRVTYNLGILDRVAMAPLFSSRTVNLGVGAQVPSVAAFALDESSLLNVIPLSQLSTDVADLSLATRELADGGTVFLAAGRLADGSAAVFDQTSSVRRVGPASGRVSIASSPAFPEYAMLTVPRAEDGGTVIYGQMVCMPR